MSDNVIKPGSYEHKFDGIKRIYGKQNQALLKNLHVAVVGIGGVGSWTVEAFARSGLGEITIIDWDDVCYSNTNRQIHALDKNIGKSKVDVLKERVFEINSSCKVNAIREYYTAENANHIISNGGKAVFHKLDVSNSSEIETVIKKIFDIEGSIDLAVNNAGIGGNFDGIHKLSLKDWNNTININLTGVFCCMQNEIKYMLKQGAGRIVNVASVAGKDGNANASAYSVGKAGAIGLTKSLGKELADKNIAVNAVTPAGAKTRILDQMTKEHVQRMLSKVPRGRFLEVEEFTSLICWLSSEENTFSTAAVFDISGGRSTY